MLKNIKWEIQYFIEGIIYRLNTMKYKLKYKDYSEEDGTQLGNLKFIWGIKSQDNIVKCPANLHTMNDIDITFDREKQVYMLGIETAYVFNNKEAECDYLKELLNYFANYMYRNKLKTDCSYGLFMSDLSIEFEAKSIEELYIKFKVFVEGYCKVYGDK